MFPKPANVENKYQFWYYRLTDQDVESTEGDDASPHTIWQIALTHL